MGNRRCGGFPVFLEFAAHSQTIRQQKMHIETSQLVSVIVPIYNELDNVDPMYRELVEAMETQDRPFELILVDDGSRDGTTH